MILERYTNVWLAHPHCVKLKCQMAKDQSDMVKAESGKRPKRQNSIKVTNDLRGNVQHIQPLLIYLTTLQRLLR